MKDGTTITLGTRILAIGHCNDFLADQVGGHGPSGTSVEQQDVAQVVCGESGNDIGDFGKGIIGGSKDGKLVISSQGTIEASRFEGSTKGRETFGATSDFA